MSLDGSADGYRAGRTLTVAAEFRRQATRRRTHLTFGFMVALPLIILAAFQVGGDDDGPAGSGRFSSLIQLATTGGLNFTLFTIFVSASVLLVVVVALCCGDTVASEASWGSLRYLLAAPVPRPGCWPPSGGRAGYSRWRSCSRHGPAGRVAVRLGAVAQRCRRITPVEGLGGSAPCRLPGGGLLVVASLAACHDPHAPLGAVGGRCCCSCRTSSTITALRRCALCHPLRRLVGVAATRWESMRQRAVSALCTGRLRTCRGGASCKDIPVDRWSWGHSRPRPRSVHDGNS